MKTVSGFNPVTTHGTQRTGRGGKHPGDALKAGFNQSAVVFGRVSKDEIQACCFGGVVP
jgi:hypothetical protein